MAELSKAELLNYAVENGIVDINTITKQIEMNERKKYLEMHKYEIWQGEKDNNGILTCRMIRKGGVY